MLVVRSHALRLVVIDDRGREPTVQQQRSESIPQPPPHLSQASGSSISTSASSAFHRVPGSKASKTTDEAASAAAAEAKACGDDAGNLQYGDPWDTDPAAVALRLLKAENNRKSPTPAHATPAAKGAPSTNVKAHQPVYEAAFELRLKQREPDQGLDRLAQSPTIILHGLQQQPRAGPLHPVPSSSSSSGVSVTPGRKGGITRQPSLQNVCCPTPRPHQGSSCSTSVSSSVQQQPAPTPRGSSSSGGGIPLVPIPAIRDPDLAFRQASVAIDQSHPLPRLSISENAPAEPVDAVTVKRSIHAGVGLLPSESVRRPGHSDHHNEAELRSVSDCTLRTFRASPSLDRLSNSSCDGPRKPEERRGGLVAVAPLTYFALFSFLLRHSLFLLFLSGPRPLFSGLSLLFRNPCLQLGAL
ncbi:hypothetical protein HPB49_011715 [Dermacentor silvarum]|uniref:Uncharacterized protein n=1 Tax=Dermacentor silvarum TaxID=543639 RepID=A0ACB8C931_DERSI|nr:hypothetical protein HPB49_011715 [Dermacentor silvarum]